MNKLPENLPQHKRKELDQITHLLTTNKAVEMLILFGSYAKGTFVEDRYVEKGITYEYQSDYDLLVVTTHDDLKQSIQIETELKQKLIERSLIKTPVSLIFHSIKHLNQSLSEGNYFFQTSKKKASSCMIPVGFNCKTPRSSPLPRLSKKHKAILTSGLPVPMSF
ncbi:MAG: nucleotidyltransferase domain-containing protein [Reichenbachiella sp.]|uniref:nucleotidyltransferase domain-containing protein n=1 Tax=Reichenbachiella sp. TaxID=2184521 RepID=UPI003264AF71